VLTQLLVPKKQCVKTVKKIFSDDTLTASVDYLALQIEVTGKKIC